MYWRAFVNVSLGFLLVISWAACGGKRVQRSEDAVLQYRVAQKLYFRGEETQALAESLEAEKLDPKNEEIQNFLGLLYAKKNLLDKAEMHFKKAIRIKSNYSEAHNNLCGFLYQQSRYDEALSHCNEAVKGVTYATPERSYHNMALIYEKTNKSEKALESYEKAVSINPNFVLSLRPLGKHFYQKKNYTRAKELLSSADQACVAAASGSWGQDCPEAQYLLALTYIQLRQRPSAIAALQNCIASDQKGSYQQKCRKSLELYR
ncbi:MAG: tetratricopeptide repeat protein [Bdellovibrionales bacterium]|nr:tetratricopeptide repeat protein [Bdellovibrionales bacterium]